MQPQPVQPTESFARPEVGVQTAKVTHHDQSDLRDFLKLIRRYALLIGCFAVVTCLATYFFSASQQKQYSGHSTLLFTPTDPTQDPTRALSTIVGVSTSQSVLAPLEHQFGKSFGELLQQVSVTADPNANLVTVTADATSPEQAARLANALSRQLIAYRAAGERQLLTAQAASLKRQLSALSGSAIPSDLAAASDLRTQLAETTAQLSVAASDLSTLTAASPSGAPVSPHPARNAVIGLLVGLLLAILIAAARERLDRRVRAVDEVESLYAAPLLGVVPYLAGRRDRSTMLANFASSSLLADAYRTIRTNIALFRVSEDAPSVIVVTSAIAQEGKSAITANLAHALSVMGKRVLAVSADLHNPSLHEYFSEPSERALIATRSARAGGPAGLVQVLAGERALADAVRPISLTPAERLGGGSLHLLADRTTFFDPAVLFTSRPMGAFLKQAKQQYDIVLFDTPPLLANADASLLAQEADILIMAARLEHLTRNQARRAAAMMTAARLHPTGLIVMGVQDQAEYGYGYRYGGDGEDFAVTPSPSAATEKRRTGSTRA